MTPVFDIARPAPSAMGSPRASVPPREPRRGAAGAPCDRGKGIIPPALSFLIPLIPLTPFP